MNIHVNTKLCREYNVRLLAKTNKQTNKRFAASKPTRKTKLIKNEQKEKMFNVFFNGNRKVVYA